MKTDPTIALKSLQASYEALKNQEDWSEEALHATLLALPAKLEMKNGQVLFPLRLAITGMQFTPGGAIEISSILGKEETLRRLESVSYTHLDVYKRQSLYLSCINGCGYLTL